MNKITFDILNKARQILCIPFLVALGAVTAPLAIIFKWQGIWILWIANAESCSLSKAKEILKDNVKYPDIGKIHYSFSDETFDNILSSNNEIYKSSNDKDSEDYYSSQAYNWHPSNVYYNLPRDN